MELPNAPPPNPGPPRIVPANQHQTPAPVIQTSLGKVRDQLLIQNRLTQHEDTPRATARSATLNPVVLQNLCAHYSVLFRSLWNQGFSQIENIPLAGVQAQCFVYARNYIHSFMIDLYSSVRDSVRKKEPLTFIEDFNPDIGFTGNKYDKFLCALFPMLHPVQQSASLEETLHIWTFDIDPNRAANNWFNIPDVAAGDLTSARQRSVQSVLERTKDLDLQVPKIGTSLGCGSTLLDFYPRGGPNHAVSWLNQDNNYPDTNLVVMFIINIDFSVARLGPRFTTQITHDIGIRNAETSPFPAAIIEEEDLVIEQWLNAYHVDGAGTRVANYALARNQAVEIVNGYYRTFWHYRKMVIAYSDETLRWNAFKQVIINN